MNFSASVHINWSFESALVFLSQKYRVANIVGEGSKHRGRFFFA